MIPFVSQKVLIINTNKYDSFYSDLYVNRILVVYIRLNWKHIYTNIITNRFTFFFTNKKILVFTFGSFTHMDFLQPP